ncbi:MAG: putative tellurite resistance protein B-like protein [Candidatus Azotimanducaceae bacterium]|jgi:uncharacterized tellurite resistance protein B-like protein
MNKLLTMLSRLVSEETSSTTPDPTRIASAAACLLIEVARSDTNQADVELNQIRRILEDRFEVNKDVTDELMIAATDQVEDAHDLFQFTQVINDAFTYPEKEALLQAMWQVAYADGNLDAIEAHIIRRVAGLLHISHDDFIRIKLRVKRDSDPSSD